MLSLSPRQLSDIKAMKFVGGVPTNPFTAQNKVNPYIRQSINNGVVQQAPFSPSGNSLYARQILPSYTPPPQSLNIPQGLQSELQDTFSGGTPLDQLQGILGQQSPDIPIFAATETQAPQPVSIPSFSLGGK